VDSPLDSLVIMELETIRVVQERLAEALPILAREADPQSAQIRFLRQMQDLRKRSERLERLLDGMSPWGTDDRRGGQQGGMSAA